MIAINSQVKVIDTKHKAAGEAGVVLAVNAAGKYLVKLDTAPDKETAFSENQLLVLC